MIRSNEFVHVERFTKNKSEIYKKNGLVRGGGAELDVCNLIAIRQIL